MPSWGCQMRATKGCNVRPKSEIDLIAMRGARAELITGSETDKVVQRTCSCASAIGSTSPSTCIPHPAITAADPLWHQKRAAPQHEDPWRGKFDSNLAPGRHLAYLTLLDRAVLSPNTLKIVGSVAW